jgi:hypothetical protein
MHAIFSIERNEKREEKEKEGGREGGRGREGEGEGGREREREGEEERGGEGERLTAGASALRHSHVPATYCSAGCASYSSKVSCQEGLAGSLTRLAVLHV